MPVPDLYQPPPRDTLEILLRLLEDEVRSRHRPPLYDLGQGHGPERGKAEEVGRTQREVAEELEIGNAVRSELEIARGDAVFGCSSKGLEIDGLDGSG